MRIVPGAHVPQLPQLPPRHQPKNKNRVALTIATVNDDFTDRKTNVPRINKRAAVVLVQEAKNTRLRRELSKKDFGVHQGRDDAQAGSAITWKKRDNLKIGRSGYRLGVEPHGAAMLTRYINFTDMNVNGAKVRMMSVHRPPARFKRLWPEFDRHLAAFVKKSPLPVVIGMDANQRNPRALARMTGLRWHAPKGSIDGFLASRSVKFENVRRAQKGSSDHHPVLARITLKKNT